MITYECEDCGKTCEIEEVEALLFSRDHEDYELGLCKDCFQNLNEK